MPKNHDARSRTVEGYGAHGDSAPEAATRACGVAAPKPQPYPTSCVLYYLKEREREREREREKELW
jgi:hypothetical protein